jgi:hypothetical protein
MLLIIWGRYLDIWNDYKHDVSDVCSGSTVKILRPDSARDIPRSALLMSRFDMFARLQRRPWRRWQNSRGGALSSACTTQLVPSTSMHLLGVGH